MEDRCEVLVIGAGASGLSACRDLIKAGCDVLCIEARDRIGGRILTVTDPLSPLPIELGPEFVHGRPPETWDLIRAGRMAVYDCDENAVHVTEGQVHEASDAWEQVDAITEEMKRVAESGADPTFLEFIAAADYSEEAKQMATSYVEGFNAARKEIIGVASLALDAEAAAAIEGDRNFRFANGYRHAIEQVLADADPASYRLELNSVAERIEWSPGSALVSVQSTPSQERRIIAARRIILTLPLGVLQAEPGTTGAVEFLPRPEQLLNAAHGLKFGQVMRVVLRFSHSWWEEHGKLGDVGFWLSRERYFPTWWTSLPMRVPLLTGWSAGPHADELVGLPRAVIIQRAIEDLGKVCGVPAGKLQHMLEAVYFHDWSADPFSRGAYSYVPAGAMARRQELSVPVAGTLFFAGEATETGGHSATVHGAIASGRRAARQVILSLGRDAIRA